MSERFYTTLHVSGPNAATAEKAAIEALKTISFDEHRACWIDADAIKDWDMTPEEREEFVEQHGPHYFDHASGELAVQTVGAVSRKYPTETFCLLVDGSYGEGEQGHVEINNGHVKDGRCEEISYGDAADPAVVKVYTISESDEVERTN